MEVIKLFALAVSCTLLSVNLHGCGGDLRSQITEHAGNAFNAAVSNACTLMVGSHVDELLLGADQSLEAKCKEQGAMSDEMCSGWSVFASMSIEESEKEKWTANCVTKVNDAVTAAGNNLGYLAQFISQWWTENGDAVKAEVTTLATNTANSAAGAVPTTIDAGIVWVCEKKVDGTIDRLVLEAKEQLATACQNAGALAQSCSTSGGQALTSVDATEKAKYEAECVDKVKGALGWSANKWGDLRTKLTDWFNSAETQGHFASIKEHCQKIVTQASTTGTATVQRLYDVAQAITRSHHLDMFVLGAAASGLLAIFVMAALLMRLRRTHASDVTAEARDDQEVE